MKFKKGDRVRVKEGYNYELTGNTGTVLSDKEMLFGVPVRFDLPRGYFHDCFGLCENKRGHCIPSACLEKLHQENSTEKKFKVGDKVVFTDTYSDHSRNPKFYPKKGTVGVITMIDEEDHEAYVQWKKGSTSKDDEWWAKFDSIESVEDTEKIIITRKGNTVIATKYNADGTTTFAKAKCHPDDEFDFDVGAKIAFGRLIGDSENNEYTYFFSQYKKLVDAGFSEAQALDLMKTMLSEAVKTVM